MKHEFKKPRIPLPEKIEMEHVPKNIYKRKGKTKKNKRDFIEELLVEQEQEQLETDYINSTTDRWE